MKMNVKILKEIDEYIKVIKTFSGEDIKEFDIETKEINIQPCNMNGSFEGLNCFITTTTKEGKKIVCNVSGGI
jgi:hypothetical protein